MIVEVVDREEVDLAEIVDLAGAAFAGVDRVEVPFAEAVAAPVVPAAAVTTAGVLAAVVFAAPVLTAVVPVAPVLATGPVLPGAAFDRVTSAGIEVAGTGPVGTVPTESVVEDTDFDGAALAADFDEAAWAATAFRSAGSAGTERAGTAFAAAERAGTAFAAAERAGTALPAVESDTAGLAARVVEGVAPSVEVLARSGLSGSGAGMLAVVGRRRVAVAAATRAVGGGGSAAPAGSVTAWAAWSAGAGPGRSGSVRVGVAVVWSPVDRSPAAVRGPAEPFVAFAITRARVP